jgi:hypothetical protein
VQRLQLGAAALELDSALQAQGSVPEELLLGGPLLLQNYATQQLVPCRRLERPGTVAVGGDCELQRPGGQVLQQLSVPLIGDVDRQLLHVWECLDGERGVDVVARPRHKASHQAATQHARCPAHQPEVPARVACALQQHQQLQLRG